MTESYNPANPPLLPISAMLDLIVLFTLFIGLVSLLALSQYWLRSKGNSISHAAGKKLLGEWLQVHHLELPTVQCLLSCLNRKLQEMESEVRNWEAKLGGLGWILEVRNWEAGRRR